MVVSSSTIQIDSVWARCLGVAEAVPGIRSWCFQNYVRVWDYVFSVRPPSPSSSRQITRSQKQQLADRRRDEMRVAAIASSSDILSDMDVMCCSSNGRASADTAQRETGSLVGLLRLHAAFRGGRDRWAVSATRRQVPAMQAPAVHRMELWSTKRADPVNVVAMGEDITTNQPHQHSSRRIAGRLDDLALTYILSSPTTTDGSPHDRARCMWCLAGWKHDTALCKLLVRFRADLPTNTS